MTNKLVIRRLPPSMSEVEFLKHVSPLPEHDYFCYFEANTNLGSHAYSRAYINFVKPNDMSIFREQFDNYVFVDKNGHEYPAVVEQSFWHKSPNYGPFRNAMLVTEEGESRSQKETSTGLDEDQDFIEFVEKIGGHKRKSKQSPIQTLETNLDAITNTSNASGTSSANNRDKSKRIVTPLVGYVNQKRLAKSAKKGRG
uniref:Regulator of nonsense transcripts 3A n=1 Tax=Aceria tosichella TaxID=561515 RepID=A0A6G1SHP5_9ACAR